MSGLSAEDYGALADELDISAITSNEGNAKILLRLKNDDPDLNRLHLGNACRQDEYTIEDAASIENARDIGVLGYYLGRCTTVTTLLLSLPEELADGIIEPFFSGLERNRSIKKVFLMNSHIPRDFFRMLTPFLKANPNLTKFSVIARGMDADQYRLLSSALREGRSLKEFYIGGLVRDGQYDHEEFILDNFEALKMHPQLERAFYDFTFRVNVCRALSDLLRQSAVGMNQLTLSNNAINDSGVEALVDGLAHCRGLRDLDLSGNPSITVRGWGVLSSLLEDPDSSLEWLNLQDSDINDESAVIFANALAHNSSLELLNLDCNVEHTGEGWKEAFSKVLCNTSSVNSTFLSNHTLQNLTRPGGRESRLPDALAASLHLNEEGDKKRVATEKILLTHDDFDMQPLFEWDLKVLPFVIQWFERAAAYGMAGTGYAILFEDEARISERKLAAIYQFIRGMPELAVEGILSVNKKSANMGGEKRLHSAAFERYGVLQCSRKIVAKK